MGAEHEKFQISQWGVFIKENKCLILKAADKDMWELPGGRINQHELDEAMAETAFRREIKEELSLTNFTIRCSVDWMVGVTRKSKTPICRLAYLITDFVGDLQLSHEHTEIKWIQESETNNFVYNDLLNAKQTPDILKRAFALLKYEEK